MTVGEIERGMSSAERAEWYGFFHLRADEDRTDRIREGLKGDALAGLDNLRKRKR